MSREITSNALRLPDGPRQLLAAAYPVLSRYLGDRYITLGGGSALAARWKHRHSTDVDLFFQDPVRHRRIYRSPDRFRKAVESIDGFRAFRFAIDGGEISFKDRSGSVSWIHSIAVTAIPVSSQVAEGTTIPLETSAEILAKKLHYRLVAAHQHLPRDIYDLAWAARFAPESCAEAIATLNSDARNSLRFSLGLLPKDWMARQLRWPLIVPADKRLPSDAVAIVLDALGRHI